MTIVVSANAQNLTLEVQANEATIGLTGATDMTALQFSMKLPEGMAIDTTSVTLGSATDGHTLCIERLDNGDLLFIIYSMELNTFTNGELLHLPIPVSGTGDVASLSSIRYAGADAVSHPTEDIVTGITSPTPNPSPRRVEIYNVFGQRLNKKQKEINIIRYSDGTTRKVLQK